MANTCEPLVNVVKIRRAKDADRLGPKGTWPGMGTVPFPIADHTAIGEQAEPNPSGHVDGTW